MAHIITCLSLFLALLALVSGQSVGTLNTPAGPITQGASVPVTWTLIAPPTLPGVLVAIDRNTTNTTTLSDNLDLNTRLFNWTVTVPPDTYTLSLNDGSGQKFSGPVQVIAPPPPAPPGSAPPASGPAPGGSAPPVSGPAPAPAAPAAPPASTPKAFVGRDVPASTSSSAQSTASAQPTHSAGNSVSIVSIYNLLLSLTSVIVCLF